MEKPKLLIVDDDESIRISMKWALGQDYELLFAEDRPSAMKMVGRERPALVSLDLGLPPDARGVEEGFRLLAEMLELDSMVKAVVVTGQDDKAHAIKAVGEGAYDFFCKPIQADEFKVVLRRAWHVYQLEREHRRLAAQLGGAAFEEILGTSPQIQEVFAAIRKVATTDVPVLIVGESGTGKELVAKAIHQRSIRKKNPFVPINCAAIPENLLESELFGHEKGAFTGAHTRRKGRIESAQGGTLFLDEIGELPLLLQVKLLRFLQEHVIERVGGRTGITVDTRVIAATNMDLQQAMKENRFREDLYYRLGVITIDVPPLRDREGDVLFLAKAFLHRYATETNKKIAGFTNAAVQALETHPWPGNVRELENRIRRAMIMAGGAKLTAEDLQLGAVKAKPRERLGLKEAREKAERQVILQSLASNQNNISRVAAELGISRPTLYELMEKLKIEKV